MGRPRPEPVVLVVKNGLKIRSLSSAGTPGRCRSPRPRSKVSARVRRPRSPDPTSTASSDGAQHDTCPAPFTRLEGVGQQIAEHLAELAGVAVHERQPLGDVDRDRRRRARGTLLSALVTDCCRTCATSVCSTCSRIGRTNSSISTTMALASFASLRMSASSDCASGRVGHLASEQSRHDLDARQRVLQFVRDAGRHFAERGEPIAQALALFHLLDLRQVLEEQHGADGAARCRCEPATACSR